jgi:hypothetical protein
MQEDSFHGTTKGQFRKILDLKKEIFRKGRLLGFLLKMWGLLFSSVP